MEAVDLPWKSGEPSGVKSMIYRLIDVKKATIPVGHGCRLLGVSSSGYYAWKRRKPSLRQCADMILLAHIRQHFALSHETGACPGGGRG